MGTRIIKGRILFGFIGGFCFAATAAIIPSAQAADPVNESESNALSTVTEAEARAIEFRKSMGFPHDLNLVQKMEDLTQAPSSMRVSGAVVSSSDISTELGVPLTSSEQGEVDLRHLVIKDDVPLIERISKKITGRQPAGVFMDNADGGILTVAVTTHTDELRKELSSKVDHPDRLRVIKAAWSMEELAGIATKIRDDRKKAPVEGVKIYALGVDERKNKVRVVATGDLVALQNYFDTRYKLGAVYIEDREIQPAIANSQLSSTFLGGVKGVHSPPFLGGQSIIGYGANGGGVVGICTSAFVVWRGAASAKNYYMMTAAHCGGKIGSTYDQPWYQGGEAQNKIAMGKVDYYDKSDADAMLINISNSSSQWDNGIDLGAGGYRAILSVQGKGADTVGDTTCLTGRNFTGIRCGELTQTSVDFEYSDYKIASKYGREVAAACAPGDSGGPVFYGNQARGVISGSISRENRPVTCLYTHIYDDLMGSTIATSG